MTNWEQMCAATSQTEMVTLVWPQIGNHQNPGITGPGQRKETRITTISGEPTYHAMGSSGPFQPMSYYTESGKKISHCPFRAQAQRSGVTDFSGDYGTGVGRVAFEGMRDAAIKQKRADSVWRRK